MAVGHCVPMTTHPDPSAPPTNLADAFVVVAVGDPVLHPEAVHVAAATTRPVVDFSDPDDGERLRRYAARAAAVLIDADFAASLPPAETGAPVYFLTSDRTPMNWEQALAVRARKAFLLPAESAELLQELADLAEPTGIVGSESAARPVHRHGRAFTIAVTGAAGGAGTSVLAAAVARHLARGSQPVTLIDADPVSGGVDLLYGIEDAPGMRWPDLLLTDSGGIDPGDLRSALPTTSDRIAVLSAARSTIDDPFVLSDAAVTRIVDALAPAPGWTIVDLPAGRTLAAADLHVLLVPAEVRAAAVAVKLVAEYRSQRLDYCVLARHRGWAGLDDADLESLLGIAPLATIADSGSLNRQLEVSGLPRRLPRSLAAAADAIVERAGGQR